MRIHSQERGYQAETEGAAVQLWWDYQIQCASYWWPKFNNIVWPKHISAQPLEHEAGVPSAMLWGLSVTSNWSNSFQGTVSCGCVCFRSESDLTVVGIAEWQRLKTSLIWSAYSVPAWPQWLSNCLTGIAQWFLTCDKRITSEVFSNGPQVSQRWQGKGRLAVHEMKKLEKQWLQEQSSVYSSPEMPS